MISLIVAGGISLAANTTEVQWPDFYNHTLKGERILAKEVVCRNRWGTPMLPDGKGGYSLIAPINPVFIQESLIIPPKTNGVVYRPLPPVAEVTIDVPPISAPPTIPPPAPAPAPADEGMPQ